MTDEQLALLNERMGRLEDSLEKVLNLLGKILDQPRQEAERRLMNEQTGPVLNRPKPWQSQQEQLDASERRPYNTSFIGFMQPAERRR